MTAEKHFNLVIALMLLFFAVNYAAEALVALQITTVKIGGGIAHDAFMAFFGVAMGIFRGMPSGNGGNSQK